LCDYYFDDAHGIAYKIDPISTSVMEDDNKKVPEKIIVYTNVKITNYRREKIRRVLSETYPIDQYDYESAKKRFKDTLLSRLVCSAKKISEQEYESIKAVVETSP